MSYLNRVWMAASVAVVQGNRDQGFVKPIQRSKEQVVSAGFAFPAAGVGVGRGVFGGCADDEAEDSLHKAMYLSCWGPS